MPKSLKLMIPNNQNRYSQKAIGSSQATLLRLLLIFFCIGLGSNIAFSQDTLNLEEAIQQGLQENYQIQIARQNRQIKRNNVSRGNAGFLPRLRLTVNQNNEINNTRQEFLSGETINRSGAEAESFNSRAELRWTLFDGFRMFTSYEKLKQIRKQGKAQFQQAVQQQVAAIINQYYQLVKLRQQLDTRKEALKLTLKQRDLAKTRMNIGSGSELAYRQTQSAYNADTASYLSKRETFKNAKVRLNKLMGAAMDQTFIVPGTIPLQGSFTFENLKEKALQQNPELQANNLEKRIAQQNMESSKGGNYPEIGLNIGYDYRQTASEAGFVSESQQHGLDYGFFLNYNLFNGFNNQRRTENARIRIKRAKLNQKQTRQELLANLRQAFTSYEASRSRVELEEDNVDVSKETLEIAQANYKAGGIDYVQLQEAQQAYLEAKQRLIAARYDAKQAEIKLMRLSGILLRKTNQ